MRTRLDGGRATEVMGQQDSQELAEPMSVDGTD